MKSKLPIQKLLSFLLIKITVVILSFIILEIGIVAVIQIIACGIALILIVGILTLTLFKIPVYYNWVMDYIKYDKYLDKIKKEDGYEE